MTENILSKPAPSFLDRNRTRRREAALAMLESDPRAVERVLQTPEVRKAEQKAARKARRAKDATKYLLRSVRIPLSLSGEIAEFAAAGTSLNRLIERALEHYTKTHKKNGEQKDRGAP